MAEHDLHDEFFTAQRAAHAEEAWGSANNTAMAVELAAADDNTINSRPI
jgi:hypothetical protein